MCLVICFAWVVEQGGNGTLYSLRRLLAKSSRALVVYGSRRNIIPNFAQMAEYIRLVNRAVEADLEVYYLDEDGTIVAFCPSLDLSTYGDSLADAEVAFQEAFEIFIENTLEKNTFESILMELGWGKLGDRFAFGHVVAQPAGQLLQVNHPHLVAA